MLYAALVELRRAAATVKAGAARLALNGGVGPLWLQRYTALASVGVARLRSLRQVGHCLPHFVALRCLTTVSLIAVLQGFIGA